jgi:hypothetical protein
MLIYTIKIYYQILLKSIGFIGMLLYLLLITLLITVIIILIITYYKQRESFTDITNESINKATETVIPVMDIPQESVKPDTPSTSSIPITPDTPDTPNTSEIVISGQGFDAMSLQQKTDLLKDIQKLVRNEILAQRQIDQSSVNVPNSSVQSESEQQGKEFNKSKPCPANPDGSCPPIPDMSQYIRKDQIPCWNCTLDY